MKLSAQVKSISYLKAHAAEVVAQLKKQREPLVITQNGEARLVVQDIESYEETQETMAMLKILALANIEIAENKVTPADTVLREIRKDRKQDK